MSNEDTQGSMDAYINICGAVVKQAIDDYKNKNSDDMDKKMSDRKRNYLDAKDFLFTNRLEDYVSKFGFGGEINLKKLREGLAR